MHRRLGRWSGFGKRGVISFLLLLFLPSPWTASSWRGRRGAAGPESPSVKPPQIQGSGSGIPFPCCPVTPAPLSRHPGAVGVRLGAAGRHQLHPGSRIFPFPGQLAERSRRQVRSRGGISPEQGRSRSRARIQPAATGSWRLFPAAGGCSRVPAALMNSSCLNPLFLLVLIIPAAADPAVMAASQPLRHF